MLFIMPYPNRTCADKEALRTPHLMTLAPALALAFALVLAACVDADEGLTVRCPVQSSPEGGMEGEPLLCGRQHNTIDCQRLFDWWLARFSLGRTHVCVWMCVVILLSY